MNFILMMCSLIKGSYIMCSYSQWSYSQWSYRQWSYRQSEATSGRCWELNSGRLCKRSIEPSLQPFTWLFKKIFIYLFYVYEYSVAVQMVVWLLGTELRTSAGSGTKDLFINM